MWLTITGYHRHTTWTPYAKNVVVTAVLRVLYRNGSENLWHVKVQEDASCTQCLGGHGTVECLGLERTLKTIQFQPLCYGQGTHSPAQAA